jgi:hypothetical protein
MADTVDPPALQHVREIYLAALAVSHEARAELAGDLRGPSHDNPDLRWGDILRRREQAGVNTVVQRAGRQVVRVAGAGDRGREVRRAVKNLTTAVEELASFTPAYGVGEQYVFELDEWVACFYPDEECAIRLDELRQRVHTRLVELDELLRDHPDPLARVLAVLRRIAVKLTPTAEGARLGRWFERLEADRG